MLIKSIKYIYKIIICSIFFYVNYIGTAMAYEEPQYKIIKSTDVYEIRYYEDRVAIRTLQPSGEDRAFRRLFKYISGANQSSSKITMTTPVIQSDEGNGLVMHFFLPKDYSIQNAPLPESDRVEVVTIKGGFYAVLKYSGRSTVQNYKKHVALLRNVLGSDGIFIKSDPIMATYNGPFTPFFLRRNEAMYRVDWE